MIEIQIKTQPVLDALNRLIQAGNDPQPILSAIGMELENRVRARFETKTDPAGRAWAPWKPATQKSYPQDGNKALLDRYGDMLDSLSHQVDGGGVIVGFGAMSKPKKGKPFSYPSAHERGTKNMARRGLLTADPDAGTLGAEDEHAILAILNDHFAKAIG